MPDIEDDKQYQVRVVKPGTKWPPETGRELRLGIMVMKGKVVRALGDAVTDVKPA